MEHGSNEEKSKVSKELDNGSLKKILKYSYANTCGRCNGDGEYYYCTIINYIHAEFRRKRKLPQYAACQILNYGLDTDCGCMEYRKNYPSHPKIDSREQQRGLSLLGIVKTIVMIVRSTRFHLWFIFQIITNPTNDNDFFKILVYYKK